MWWYRTYFPRSRPRAVKGGIKAQSKSGAFGSSWWAKRWIAILESFRIGARLQRGRSYARGGQVRSIEIAKGSVTAKVQGSRPRPYDVQIGVKPLTTKDWQRLVEALDGQALFAAKLLAGEMPHEIETVFENVGLSLFPKMLNDLETSCSCPDYSNPCKHIAAVYYLLGEEFDRDPFLMFKLRGLGREELLQQLDAASAIDESGRRKAVDEPAPEPLTADVKSYWSRGDLAADFFAPVELPPISAALPKRLGAFPFWRGNERFLEAMELVYRQASKRGLDVLQGEVLQSPDQT
jgi:uncharacterized Zn finger protein